VIPKHYQLLKDLVILFCFSLTVLILISQQAYAADGCFLYQDSNNYCQELSSEQAETECELYEDCSMEVHYLFGTACNMQEECETILCQSSCKTEYYGNCPYGAVPENEQTEWCQEGCCRFEHTFGNFCEVLPNKWYCEIEADNKGIDEIHWSTLNEEQCQQECSATINYQTFSLTKKDFSKDVPVQTYILPEQTVAELEPEKAEEQADSVANFVTPLIRAGFLGVLLGGIVIGAAIFFFRILKERREEKGPKKKEDFDYPLPKDEEKPEPKKRGWLFSPKEIARRLKLLRKQHDIKKKEHEVEENFGTFSKNETQLSHLDKLKHIIKAKERKEKKKEERRKKKSEWHLQKVLAGEIKVKPKGGKNLTELERIEAVEELRAILRKKNSKDNNK